MIRFLSLFSGVEAASLAWQPLGWKAVAFAETDPFCCELLAQRFPDVPNLGDVTAPDFVARALALGPIDLVVGGPPCQSFSVAGLRAGMADARGTLSLRYCEVIHGIDPEWAIFENVPGLLSHRANPFGYFLARLVGAARPLPPPRGRGWTDGGLVSGPRRVAAWRVLDAQYQSLAQRRRRVFIVSGRAGTIRAAEVLFESEILRRDPAPRREKGQGATHDLAGSLGGGSGARGWCSDTDRATFVACFGGNNTTGAIDVATACNAHGGTGRSDFESETFAVTHPLRGGFDASEDGTGRGTPHAGQASTYAVRRLVPEETEALQGMPRGWTLVTARGKPAADGPRYKAIGNSMAVSVMRWIGERIAKAAAGQTGIA